MLMVNQLAGFGVGGGGPPPYQGVNLLDTIGANLSAQSQYSSTYSAARVSDGSESTFWHSGGGGTQWFRIALNEPAWVHRFGVAGCPSGWLGYMMRPITFGASETNASGYVTVLTGSSASYSQYTEKQFILPEPVFARYWQLSGPGGSRVTLGTVRVLT